jgi:predicted transcriptional regulator
MDTEKRMTVRLPDDLHKRLERIARVNRRSLHAQLLVYLEDGLDQDEPGEDQDGS